EKYRTPWEFIVSLARDTQKHESGESDIGLYILPIKNYFPLAMFDAIMQVEEHYRKNFGVEIVVEIETDGDNHFPRRWEYFLPGESAADKGFEIMREMAICSHICNFGVMAGITHVRFSSKEKTDKANELINKIRILLNDRTSGFELTLHGYVEKYVRSRDVTSQDESIVPDSFIKDYMGNIENLRKVWEGDDQKYSIGIDIGASSIKMELFYGFDHMQSSRLSSEKLSGNSVELYENLEEFLRRIVQHCEAELLAKRKVKWPMVKLFGLCWPGLLRSGKIAGTSSIMNNFSSKVGSAKMREITVEQMRQLDIAKTLDKILKDKCNTPVPTVALVNDGTSELIGAILSDLSYGTGKWMLFKLGTGLASGVLEEGILRNGIMEFGKVTHNIFAIDRHANPDDPKDEHKTRPGMNSNISSKMFPALFSEMTRSTMTVSSYEIGRIAEYVFCEENDINDLVKDIGIDHVYQHDFSTFLDKETVEKRYGDTSSFSSHCNHVGTVRIALICDAFGMNKGNIDHLRFCSMVNTLSPARLAYCHTEINESILRESVLNCKNKLKELIDRAGSLMSDGIALMRTYYKATGVILSGGVLQEGKTTKRLIDSLELHLDRKYHIRLKDFNQFKHDLNNSEVGKREYSTLYCNLIKDDNNNWLIDSQKELGRLGGVYMAAITCLFRKQS
ncbi:MAG: ROK family protein, partial [Magnetococcales bacterium]|nr:ROK family protein [Magnetococcales bacterium]